MSAGQESDLARLDRSGDHHTTSMAIGSVHQRALIAGVTVPIGQEIWARKGWLDVKELKDH